MRILKLQYFQMSDVQQMIEVPPLKKCKFDKIYQLGDSLSDTGNFIRESFLGSFSPFPRLRYGENFIQNKSTGRCSDGLLMIDFIYCSEEVAQALFMVGEIGGNEFNYGLLLGKLLEDLRAMVPEVVQIIIDGVKLDLEPSGFFITHLVLTSRSFISSSLQTNVKELLMVGTLRQIIWLDLLAFCILLSA